MSTDRDTTRVVRSWLEEGVTALPDRVLDAVLDQLPATPQRRLVWRLRRSFQMNSPVRFAIAAAAVLVVALVGYQLLPSNTGSGGKTPVPSPTVVPLPTEIPRLPPSGPIDAGTYRMGTSPTLLVTVPAGWTSSGGMSIRKNFDQPNEVTALQLYSDDIRVFADACQSEGTEEPIGPTTDDLLTALLAQENSDISDPVDVTIAGLPGKRFEVSAPAGVDLAQCSIGSLQIWVDSAGSYLAGVGLDGGVATMFVADAPGGRLVTVPSLGNATPADIAERDAIIASIEILE